MKKISILYFTFIFIILSSTASAVCFPDGCVTVSPKSPAGESGYKYFYYQAIEVLNRTSLAGFSGTVNVREASHGHPTTLTIVNGIITGGVCANGDSYPFYVTPACSNGANNPPACNVCPAGSNMINGTCTCGNGASNPGACNMCPAGTSLVNNICSCTNGATNPTQCNMCPVGSNMVNNQCVCSNGATPQSSCLACPSGKIMHNNICEDSCSMTNVCGQNVQGVMINGKCSTVDNSNANASCITTFNVSSDNVAPNGSVEFIWKIAQVPGIGSRCGFVDLTTPTPRPIPGLQNLDSNTDRIRINNIQTTTRFCLVCQFYTLVDNATLGDAVVHQWIRVIRIGES